MINLLPEQLKKDLRKLESRKKIFIILSFLAVALIFLSLLFSGLEKYVGAKVKTMRDGLAVLQEKLNVPEFNEFQKEVREINQDLLKIQSYFKEQIFIAPIFEKLARIVPQTIYFSSFSFQKKTKEIEKDGIKKTILVFNVYISGWAENRDDLYLFKQKLEQELMFENINFLPNAWLKPKDIDFSFTLNYAPE